MKLHLIAAVLLLSSAVFAADFSVGVSPNIIDLGDVVPGEQKLMKFSIFTVSTENLLIYLAAESGSVDFFNTRTDLLPKFSEERTASWIEFVANPIEIDTTSERIADRSWKDINVLLNVPQGAEPGYHVAYVTPNPTVFGTPENAVATIVSVVKIPIFFNVDGNAKRRGIILDTTAHSYTGNSFMLKTYFQNTGTLTLYALAENNIYDENGTFVGSFPSTREYVKPGETVALVSSVNSHMPEGIYKVSSRARFTTGDTIKDSVITLSGEAEPIVQEAEFPWLIVILIIMVIIVIIVLRWLIARRV